MLPLCLSDSEQLKTRILDFTVSKIDIIALPYASLVLFLSLREIYSVIVVVL